MKESSALPGWPRRMISRMQNTNADMTPDLKIGVIGGGSWGTALANVLATKGFAIEMWVYEQEVREQIQSMKENRLFLPGVPLSSNLTPTNDLKAAASNKDILLLVVPSHLMRSVTETMAQAVNPETVVVTASKGIENITHLTMSGVLQEVLPQIPEDQYSIRSRRPSPPCLDHHGKRPPERRCYWIRPHTSAPGCCS